MMNIASILLLAYTMRSLELGQFFQLPSWMPIYVTSSRTPGSDDSTDATHRLDATSLAAVNACFDAYFERVYCFSEGNSNVWNESEYGTRIPNHEFRFADPVDPSRLFVYDPDTNRTISTRRLNEYDNLSRLAHKIGCGSQLKAYNLSVSRPNWERCSYWYYSSTLFDSLPEHGSIEIPQIGWTLGDTYVSSLTADEWARVALHWGNLETKYRLEGDDRIVYFAEMNYSGFIPTELITNVHFYEPPFKDHKWLFDKRMPNYVATGYARRSWLVTNTTAQIIGKSENVISEGVTNRVVGVDGITNETHRLITDRVAGIGRALAALDRTYYPLEPVHSYVASRKKYTRHMHLEAEPHVFPVAWDYSGEGHIDTVSPIEISGLSQHGEIETTTNEFESLSEVDQCYVNRVGCTYSSAEPSARLEDRTWKASFYIDLEDIKHVLNQYTSSSWDADFELIPQTGIIDERHYNVVGVRVLFYLSVNQRSVGLFSTASIVKELPASISVVCGAGYNRSYNTLKTKSPGPKFPDGHQIHPGRIGLSRCREAGVWSVMGVAARYGTEDDPIDIGQITVYTENYPFDGGYYMSSYRNYTTHSTCVDAVQREYDLMRDKADELVQIRCGTRATDDPVVMLPMSPSDMSGNTLIVDNAMTVRALSSPSGMTDPEAKDPLPPHFIRGHYRNRVISGLKFFDQNGNEMSAEFPQEIASINLDVGSPRWKDGEEHPRVTEKHGVSAAGKIMSISKIDWRWDALRRETSGGGNQ